MRLIVVFSKTQSTGKFANFLCLLRVQNSSASADPLTKGSAPGPLWGLRPQTSATTPLPLTANPLASPLILMASTDDDIDDFDVDDDDVSSSLDS